MIFITVTCFYNISLIPQYASYDNKLFFFLSVGYSMLWLLIYVSYLARVTIDISKSYDLDKDGCKEKLLLSHNFFVSKVKDTSKICLLYTTFCQLKKMINL